MERRQRRAVALTAIALAGLGAGTLGMRHDIAHASAPAQHSKAMTNVKFILNWIPNVEFAGLWVAQQKGWWKQAGINMTYTPYSVSVHPETDVPSQGGDTFGFQSGAALAIARAQGVPDRAVYTDTQKSIFGLTVLASSKINKVSDLRGKRIGYQPHELYVPSTMLSHAGIKAGQWTPVSVGYTTEPLTQGQVDAYLTFLNNEPIELALQGVKTRSFSAAANGFHAYDDVMFTTDKLIQQDPPLVKKVTAIVARGFKWAHSHHQKAVNISMAYKGNGAAFKLNHTQQLKEMAAFDQFSRDYKGQFSGRMNAQTWAGTINTLYQYGEIKRKPAATDMFTNQFNPLQY